MDFKSSPSASHIGEQQYRFYMIYFVILTTGDGRSFNLKNIVSQTISSQVLDQEKLTVGHKLVIERSSLGFIVGKMID
ncbi:hypothetical protein Y697_00520 [Mesotoga sp. BH458_6_3_2_1]|nr:hypothetical protein Y697_00520 [Mesotoga sp. BH458_6_3_2_1]